jgi:hypothetical protein
MKKIKNTLLLSIEILGSIALLLLDPRINNSRTYLHPKHKKFKRVSGLFIVVLMLVLIAHIAIKKFN